MFVEVTPAVDERNPGASAFDNYGNLPGSVDGVGKVMLSQSGADDDVSLMHLEVAEGEFAGLERLAENQKIKINVDR